jgi:hypothetical protein
MMSLVSGGEEVGGRWTGAGEGVSEQIEDAKSTCQAEASLASKER